MIPSGAGISTSISTSSFLSAHQTTYMSATSSNFFNTVTPVPDWSEADVKEWLQSVGCDDLAQVSEEHGIDGAVLIHLDFESLKDMGFVKVGQRLRLMRLINELLSFSDDDNSLRSHMTGGQINFECNLWNAVQNQNDRIRALENQVWALVQTTQTLRERTDSLSSFNTSWTMHSGGDSLALQSSKPSADSGNSTPPTTASPIRTAVTSTQIKLQEGYNFCNYTQSPRETTPSKQCHFHAAERPTRALDGLNFFSPSKLSQTKARRCSVSPEGSLDLSYHGIELSPSNSKTPQAIQSPQNAALLPSPLPQSDFLSGASQENSYTSHELRSKNSALKLDSTVAEGTVPGAQSGQATSSSQVKATSVSGNGFIVARKPSLLTRRVGNSGQGIGVRSMRSGGASNENRAAAVWKRSSSTTGLSTFQDDVNNLKAFSPSRINNKPVGSTQINRSASTSNLKAVGSSNSKSNQNLKLLNNQNSVKVKSNNEQSVIEVLSNHLATFYVNEPHAWSKHVLLLRINDFKEYCLSYDEIPLKVYRYFKSKPGIDFAIRPIEDIPSPLRVTGNNRKKNPTFTVETELTASEDSKFYNQDSKKVDVERKPLAYGLALCGYQAELPEEINIKAGESFKLKSYFKGRYLLERETNFLSSSPLLLACGSNWIQSPSPTRRTNVTQNGHTGWVPESCILESTQSMRTINSNGSSLKHLISSPLVNTEEFLDVSNLTTCKICLISFQSQFMTWSGELSKVVQGEKILVFNHKTRFHWVYCLRQSNGERGWLPKWILSSNLQVLPEPNCPDPQNKLQTYLLQKTTNQIRNSVARPHDHSSNRNVALLGRSSSSVSALKKKGIHESRLSPTSLHIFRGLNMPNISSEQVADSHFQNLSQTTNMNTPTDETQEAIDSSAQLNRSTDVARSLSFTPRSRRSRIGSILAS